MNYAFAYIQKRIKVNRLLINASILSVLRIFMIGDILLQLICVLRVWNELGRPKIVRAMILPALILILSACLGIKNRHYVFGCQTIADFPVFVPVPDLGYFRSNASEKYSTFDLHLINQYWDLENCQYCDIVKNPKGKKWYAFRSLCVHHWFFYNSDQKNGKISCTF